MGTICLLSLLTLVLHHLLHYILSLTPFCFPNLITGVALILILVYAGIPPWYTLNFLDLIVHDAVLQGNPRFTVYGYGLGVHLLVHFMCLIVNTE